MISQKSIDEVFESARIEEIVRAYVDLKKRGANLLGLCPFHNEKTPSFTVSPAKNIYKCFGCGKGGNSVQFIMEHEKMTFPEAIKHLAEKLNIDLEETFNSNFSKEDQEQNESLYIINQFAKEYFNKQLTDTDYGKSIGMAYFKSRGFSEQTISKFGLGYAPQGSDKFYKKAIESGYKAELIRKAGLANDHGRDFFRNRVMFTIFNLSGKPAAFAGRTMSTDKKSPKYINSPETDIYNKSKTLYGLNFARKAIRTADESLLVEGYTDVITLHQNGVENAVATSGTSLTEGQIRILKRYSDNIKILYDSDNAGIKAALRGLDMLLEQGLNVKIVLLPDGDDPDSLLRNLGVSAFKEFIEEKAKDFILFKTELFAEESKKDPIKKSKLVKDIVSSIAKIPDPIIRNSYVQYCSELMRIEEHVLIAETKKAIKEILRQRKLRGDYERRTLASKLTVEGEAKAANDIKFREFKDEFQEKDIIRILVTGGDKFVDKEEKILVSALIVDELAEIEDCFENPIYAKIFEHTKTAISQGVKPKLEYYVNHPDADIAGTAVSLSSTEHEYSPNWIDKWKLPLQSQDAPEDNFSNDSFQSILHFKRRKVRKLMKATQAKIKEAELADDFEEVIFQTKIYITLKETENIIGQKTKTVVLPD